MATYFRRSRKVAPGVRVNASKSGASISFGQRRARTCVGKRGITRTYGIPGTGVYHREFTSWAKLEEQRRQRKVRDDVARQSLNATFYDQPLLCILSILCFAFGAIVVIAPELSWWWLLPALVGGFGFMLTALFRHDCKKDVIAKSESEYTTIHIPSFMKKYTPVMCNALFTTLQGYQDNQIEYVELTTSTIAELDALLAPNTSSPRQPQSKPLCKTV